MSKKKVKDPKRQVTSAWSQFISEIGLSGQARADLLLSFITSSAEKHPGLSEEFKEYVRETAESINGGTLD